MPYYVFKIPPPTQESKREPLLNASVRLGLFYELLNRYLYDRYFYPL